MRAVGSLLLAGALVEGSGALYVLNSAVNNGNDVKEQETFAAMLSVGAVGFLFLAGGAAYKFVEASLEKNGNQGTYDLLERLESGECVPIHSGGGSD